MVRRRYRFIYFLDKLVGPFNVGRLAFILTYNPLVGSLLGLEFYRFGQIAF